MPRAACGNRFVRDFSRSRFQRVSPAGPKKPRRMLLSTPTTSCPCRSKCSTASEPISPLLPVTKTFIRSNPLLSGWAQNHGRRVQLYILLPEILKIRDERSAPSPEEYQQSPRNLTALT